MPGNLPAIFQVAFVAVPAPVAILRYGINEGTQKMFSRKLTKSIAAGAAAIAIAGGSYGIVSATSSSGSTAASSGPAASPSASAGSGSASRSFRAISILMS
jgi:hypothetical protein